MCAGNFQVHKTTHQIVGGDQSIVYKINNLEITSTSLQNNGHLLRVWEHYGCFKVVVVVVVVVVAAAAALAAVVVVNQLKHDEVLGEVLPSRRGTMTAVVTFYIIWKTNPSEIQRSYKI